MMTRKEAEDGIRHLALKWMHETDFRAEPKNYPSFLAFKRWLDDNHHGLHLRFRSQISAEAEAEGWFESEIRNYWRSIESR